MLRKLLKNKKAQNVAEYAILISIVVGGIVAMQVFVQRGMQGRIRDAVAVYLQNATGDLGNTVQYEPYYLERDYTVDTNDSETRILTNETTRMDILSNSTRAKGGSEVSTYNASGLINGI